MVAINRPSAATVTSADTMTSSKKGYAAYLLIDGITGQSASESHPGSDGWMVLNDWSYAAERANSTRTGGQINKGNAAVGDVVVRKMVDLSTPQIANSLFKGTVHGEARIEVCRTTGEGELVFLIISLTKVLVTHTSVAETAIDESSNLPVETVFLNFEEIFISQNLGEGSIEAKYNTATVVSE